MFFAYFNSRPYVRGDAIIASHICKVVFQFTPLREGRRASVSFPKSVILFQFTPLREGRRIALGALAVPVVISIHAPT